MHSGPHTLQARCEYPLPVHGKPTSDKQVKVAHVPSTMTEEVRNVKTIGQTAMKINDYLSADEYIEFQLCRNAQATRILLANWAVIIATFTLIARYTNPASILLGAFILAGRIHGLGVIMHEGSHNSFFKQRILNQILGHWSPAGLPRLLTWLGRNRT